MTTQKMIFCIIAFLTAFNVAQAMEIKNGTLINKKVWNTGQFTSSFLDAKNPSKHASIVNEIKKSIHSTTSPDIDATIDLDSTQLTGTTTTPTSIGSENNMTITNASAAAQLYDIITRMCVQGTSFTEQCANEEEEIQLYPQGTVTISQLPTMNITLSKPGSYITAAGVEIIEGNLDSQYWTTGELTIKSSV